MGIVRRTISDGYRIREIALHRRKVAQLWTQLTGDEFKMVALGRAMPP
jgi:hypothetical protein